MYKDFINIGEAELKIMKFVWKSVEAINFFLRLKDKDLKK